jgi:hypothetical protein
MLIILRSSVNSLVVIYYASNVFVSLGLTGGTTSLLATGVTGVVFMVSTVPAMVSRLYVTQYCGCH